MTTPIKTQCPHCHACSTIQQTQLNQGDAALCCEHCQQSFLVNKHLIVTTTNSGDKRNLEALLASDTLIHDDLIHDDMDIEDSPEISAEYDSLDSMDAWLSQANNSSHASFGTKEQLKTTAKTPDKHAASSPAQVALSSTAANDIHASVDDSDDNSWLEKLLKEQNNSEEATADNTDLTQLLLSMGVPVTDEDNTHKARRKTLSAQKKFAPTPGRHSIASLLWTLGSFVLALLLFAQYVIFNLDTLIKNPAYAERLQTVCTVAACRLPHADLAALTMTDLYHKPSQIKVAGAFSDVSATLSNQSAQAQLLPNLKVSIYSPNALIGEFIAAPEDYLLSTQNQLAADGHKKLLFTIPVANDQINEVTIHPIY